MPRWLFWSGCALLVIAFLGYAYQPLFAGSSTAPAPGFLHDDFRTLVEVERCLHPPEGARLAERVDASFQVDTTGGHPLAALSLALSAWLWSDGGSWVGRTPFALRAENLLLLLLASVGTWAFVRRLLWPWTGSEQANAAGATAGLLLALHPTNPASVVALASRGDLIALALASASGAAFLRSRQERPFAFSVIAGALAILAGLASDLAWLLPLALAGAEFFSARRYRPLHVRLRTTLTTLLVFGACVGLDTFARSIQRGELVLPAPFRALAQIASSGAAWNAFAIAVEKLGVLVVPVNIARLGFFGFVGAGLLLLSALQPALVAARSAPRLWGAFLLAWVASIVIAGAVQPLARVQLQDWTHARVLLPGAAVMCVALALAATALSDLRRALLPLFLAAGFAALAHGNARPFASAARLLEQLRGELVDARELHGRSARILVLEPPQLVRGVDVVGEALGWMLHPLFSGGASEPADGKRASGGSGAVGEGASVEPPWVRGITRPALVALARLEEFSTLRREPLVLLFRRDDLDHERPATSGPRESLLVPPPAPTVGTRKWFREGSSSLVDLEALTSRAVRARVAGPVDTSKPPTLGWKAQGAPVRGGPLAREGTLAGAWSTVEDETSALFDTGASLAWLLGNRIRLLWPVEGWSNLSDTDALIDQPAFETPLAVRVEGSDWRIARPRHAYVDAAGARRSWRLELVDLATFAWSEVALREEGGDLLASGAEAQAQAWKAAGGGKVAWSLELLIDGVIAVRGRGSR